MCKSAASWTRDQTVLFQQKQSHLVNDTCPHQDIHLLARSITHGCIFICALIFMFNVIHSDSHPLPLIYSYISLLLTNTHSHTYTFTYSFIHANCYQISQSEHDYSIKLSLPFKWWVDGLLIFMVNIRCVSWILTLLNDFEFDLNKTNIIGYLRYCSLTRPTVNIMIDKLDKQRIIQQSKTWNIWVMIVFLSSDYELIRSWENKIIFTLWRLQNVNTESSIVRV